VSLVKGITPRTTSFNLSNIEAKLIAGNEGDFQAAKDHSEALKSAKLKLKINKAMNPQPNFMGDPELLANISQIQFDSGDIDAAM